MTASGADEEAFVGQAEGQLEEGAQVLADLEGQQEEGQRLALHAQPRACSMRRLHARLASAILTQLLEFSQRMM